ncbi:hypothetical protein [Limimaricola soesokkakensis]|nr:hypothetical protein [Limimaricola soesokkakensis]
MTENARAAGDIDFFEPVARMPTRLLQIPRGVWAPGPFDETGDTHRVQHEIVQVLRSRMARDFSGYKTRTFMRRVAHEGPADPRTRGVSAAAARRRRGGLGSLSRPADQRDGLFPGSRGLRGAALRQAQKSPRPATRQVMMLENEGHEAVERELRELLQATIVEYETALEELNP